MCMFTHRYTRIHAYIRHEVVNPKIIHFRHDLWFGAEVMTDKERKVDAAGERISHVSIRDTWVFIVLLELLNSF